MGTDEPPLIRTKLAPPRAGSQPVRRDALLKQLDEGSNGKLALVLGPAGCGKTVLLTQWRSELLLRGAKVAWYNAGTDDDDALAAAYLVESLVQAGVAIDKRALRLYLRSGAKAWQPLLASLIDDVCRQESHVYLVIDDLHHLSSFCTLKLLDRWLSLAPECFHMVLSSRTRPPLKLGRLQAEDQLTELQFPELRFSGDETHRFLQAQRLDKLTPVQVGSLHEMTDGWAAGLQLLAFSLRKDKNPEQFFEREGGLSLSRVDALEHYLETSVVQHLAADELSFLVQISACRRFNRDLCQLLTGNPRAGEHLSRFESENLFLIPIDTNDREPWYRFHRLFAEFLNNRLQRLGDAELRKVHHLASRWFSDANLPVEAMRHATLAGDAAFAVELVDRHARRMINGANFVELLRWCAAVPPESLRSRLNVCLCAAWAQLVCGRLDDFERNMAGIADHPDLRHADQATEMKLLRALHFMGRDDTRACLDILEPMLGEPPPPSTFNSLLLYQLAGLSLVQAGDFQRAREVAQLRHQVDTCERPEYPRPMVDIVAGFSHLLQGSIRLAADALTVYIDDALERRLHGVDAAGLYAGYLLEALYQSGGVRQAQEFLDRHLDLVEAVDFADGILFAYLVRARLQRLAGDPRGARETLLRLADIGCRKRLDRILAWSLHEQVVLCLGQGLSLPVRDLLEQLDRLSAGYRSEHCCAWSEIELAARMAHAMAAFANDSPDCLAAIDAAEEVAVQNRRLLLSTRLGLMRAITMLRRGRSDAGLELGRRMVAVAAETGMMRLLPDLGSPALLLADALQQAGTDDSMQLLLQAAVSELRPGPDQPEQDQPRLEAPRRDRCARPAMRLLSVKEGEVLALLGKGLTAKSVARTMSIAPGTVKWHIKNLYDKLGALSREDALAKARQLRILA